MSTYVGSPRSIRKLCVIATLILAIVLFNVFPENVGVVTSGKGPAGFVPLFAPEFSVHLPWLNLWWGLMLIFNLLNLTLGAMALNGGRWGRLTRWVELMLSVLGMFVVYKMMAEGSVARADIPFVPIVINVTLALSLLVLVMTSGRIFRNLLEEEPVGA